MPFATCCSVSSRISKRRLRRGLEQFRQHAFFNPNATGNPASGPLFEQFLSNLAVDFDELPGSVGRIKDERTLMLNLTAFRTRPIWRFSPNSYLCVDPCLLVEKLASGFYWTVNAALDTDKRRLQFSQLWGNPIRRACS